MEVDCGAAVSVISFEMYEGDFDHIPLQKCDKKLAVINGSRLTVEGHIQVYVEFNNQKKDVYLIVLRSDNCFTPLLGRDWLDLFVPDWRRAFGSNINQLAVSTDQTVAEIQSFRWRSGVSGAPQSTQGVWHEQKKVWFDFCEGKGEQSST
ncbi:uncharacterized protein LOC131438871 [Malaya genurostris]|uniref:uncharacterized protein LOC131438871 n=1 Tax=Malaya genurostris TaxID=325434 RepID=UPI0026F3F1A1|nr:uncharacterized protein LOC131438871 [Malaya genurostris]